MKCINKGYIKGLRLGVCVTLCLTLLTGCGKEFSFPYSMKSSVSSFSINQTAVEAEVKEPFANNLCITNGDVSGVVSQNDDRFYAAGVFDLRNKQVLYAKNVHKQLNPASLTKIMTALVAMEYGNMDDIITCGENVRITEQGAQLIGLKPGDHLTMNQALHALLMYSANDAAVAIAEHISGDVDSFCKLMNEEAVRIGATNCHFTNPHGLTQEGHLVTAYDLYLIFNEAMQREDFVSIIQMKSYETVYHDAEGNEKTMSFETTNLFLKEDVKAPDGITVIGGKTGTTNAARNCLILLAKDSAGDSYISVILGDEERVKMYEDMVNLLSEITAK